MNWANFAGFGPLLPRQRFNLGKIYTRGSDKNSALTFFGKLRLMEKLHVTKVLIFFFRLQKKYFGKYVGKLPTNCLSVFDHFLGLALKGLKFQNNMTLRKGKEKFR